MTFNAAYFKLGKKVVIDDGMDLQNSKIAQKMQVCSGDMLCTKSLPQPPIKHSDHHAHAVQRHCWKMSISTPRNICSKKPSYRIVQSLPSELLLPKPRLSLLTLRFAFSRSTVCRDTTCPRRLIGRGFTPLDPIKLLVLRVTFSA